MGTPFSFSWILLFGGLAFFFFGLKYARLGLQLLSGDRMRLAIAHLTENRFKALALGTFITVILQSSTATILMLISLASTGLLALSQAFGVILGADIGTTFVVILLSIKKISDYALLLVVVGFLLEWLLKSSKKIKYAGQVLFGFGMLFYGMKLMTQTAAPLAANPQARILFELLAHHPVALLVAAVGLTILVQTSAVTIGMAMALGLSGVLDFSSAIPIVFGANVGTCFSAMAASFGGNVNGKRVAVAHLFVKVAGVLLAMPFIPSIVWVVEKISETLTHWFVFIQPGVAGNIAIVHLLFNVALAGLFLPFTPLGIWVVSRLVPERARSESFGPKYLDKGALDTPPLAFAQAKQEILRIANLTRDLYGGCLKMLERSLDIDRVVSEIEEIDDKVDLLDREVRFYLAAISQEELTDAQTSQQMGLLSVAADLEGIGDIISKELARLARKKSAKERVFSEQGWEDIQSLHRSGLDNFALAIAVFMAPNEELVRKVLHHGEHFDELETKLRQAHIQRLHAGQPEVFETSSIHLDVLGNLRRINAHLVHIAQLAMQS